MPEFGSWDQSKALVQAELDRAAKGLHDVRNALQAIALANERQTEILERVDHVITGNGKPPIGERLATLESGAETRRWFFRTLIAAIVGVSVIGGAAIVKSAVRAEQVQQK